MPRRSPALVLALGIGTMFVILYLASLTAEPGRPRGDIIPTEPRITQLEAIRIIENHLISEIDGIEETRLQFALYNFSSIEYESSSEYREYRHNLRFGWDIAHVKEHPELLNLPLFFVHANGTSYAVNSTDRSLEKMCDEPSPVCPMGRLATIAARDRLVYGAEIAWLPFDLNALSNHGWYTVDAETGQIVWNNIDYQKNRKPMPNVNFDNRTIRELVEERLYPPETAHVTIQRGALDPNNERPYIPREIRVSLGIDNKIIWKNMDLVPHTVVSDNEYSNSYTGRFESRLIEPENTFEYTFFELGEYPYHCDIHPWMTGTVFAVEGFS